MKSIFTFLLFISFVLNIDAQKIHRNAAIILPNNTFIGTTIGLMTTEEGLFLKNKYAVYSEEAIFAMIYFDINGTDFTTYAKRGSFNGEIYFSKKISIFSFKNIGKDVNGGNLFIYEDPDEPYLVLLYTDNTESVDIIYYPYIDYNDNKNLIYSRQAEKVFQVMIFQNKELLLLKIKI